MTSEKPDEKYSAELPILGGSLEVTNPDLLHKVADLALVPATELAQLSATLVRLVALPFRITETYGQRILETVRNAGAQVPAERQIEAAPSIAGPILENVKHLENGNPLLRMYENLLARALDRDRVNEAHPAFPKIIEQLSPDEAKLLLLIRDQPIALVNRARQYSDRFGKSAFTHEIESDTTPRDKLLFPRHAQMYVSHLKSLNLLVQPTVDRTDDEDQPEMLDENGEAYSMWELKQEIRLSQLGRLFAQACLPERWEG